MADIDCKMGIEQCNKKDCLECSLYWSKKAEEQEPAIVKTNKQLIDTL